jgi:hypothetical protein
VSRSTFRCVDVCVCAASVSAAKDRVHTFFTPLATEPGLSEAATARVSEARRVGLFHSLSVSDTHVRRCWAPSTHWARANALCSPNNTQNSPRSLPRSKRVNPVQHLLWTPHRPSVVNLLQSARHVCGLYRSHRATWDGLPHTIVGSVDLPLWLPSWSGVRSSAPLLCSPHLPPCALCSSSLYCTRHGCWRVECAGGVPTDQPRGDVWHSAFLKVESTAALVCQRRAPWCKINAAV